MESGPKGVRLRVFILGNTYYLQPQLHANIPAVEVDEESDTEDETEEEEEDIDVAMVVRAVVFVEDRLTKGKRLVLRAAIPHLDYKNYDFPDVVDCEAMSHIN
ncbi:uncharacterized protein LOC131007311 [Salvia miltiorrhiza]|uniref:uncharacterized protein LOC131007311 n=1 Tax=Salvia miltiorrhiza TaxID=226208 RepID=UPI0025AC6C56|nr:uncharacterized protein LOC131007311 [Salvia miltiorrhiza]